MEAGGLEVRPGFFGVVGEELTFLTHIQSYRHGPTDLFSIGASSSATRFYLTKPVLLQGESLLYPTPFLITRQKSPTRHFQALTSKKRDALRSKGFRAAAAPLLLALSYLVKQPFALGAHLFPKIEYLEVGKDPPLVSVRMSPRDPWRGQAV
ncbi:hypothetical protein KY285_005044 [Solanum tuberosum]|nr:hypothetical protein KY285_005044 [Solanum tuberosum]